MTDSLTGSTVSENISSPVAPVASGKRMEALQLVRRMSYWSAGAGVIPIPFVDFAAIAGVQLKMVNDLSQLYNVTFHEMRAKALIGALIGSVLPFQAAVGVTGLLMMAIKSAPGIGAIAGAMTLPAVAGAATYALGKLFIEHFESGGTLLDFDADKMRARFRSEMETARTDRYPSSTGSATVGS